MSKRGKRSERGKKSGKPGPKPGPKSGLNPRRVALRTLRDIEQREGFSNRILSEQLERFPELARRDRGLITNLVYGVLRNRGRLDALIDRFANKPKRIKGELRMIMRMASFEIVELDRPLAVASSEAARLAGRLDPRGRLKSMIAAILSSVDRKWRELDAQLLDAERDPLAALTQRWSLPEWLARRWLAQLGPERARARAAALNQPPSVDLRVDLSRAEPAQIRERLLADHPGLRLIELPEAVGEQPQCLRIRGGGDVFYGPVFEAGLIAVQSLGSQQAVRALDPQAGETILDACAGMGTKTVQIAEHMGRRGRIVAVDLSGDRLAELEGQRERAELDVETLELVVREADLSDPEDAADLLTAASFDAVLVDAPCTGLGNLARHPELRWTAEAANVVERAGLQAALLRRCAGLVRPGGRLVYAVCSLEPEEGSAIVEAFLASDAGADFELAQTQAWTPEEHESDGFWLARLARRPAS